MLSCVFLSHAGAGRDSACKKGVFSEVFIRCVEKLNPSIIQLGAVRVGEFMCSPCSKCLLFICVEDVPGDLANFYLEAVTGLSS